jgi:hypothetical protein
MSASRKSRNKITVRPEKHSMMNGASRSEDPFATSGMTLHCDFVEALLLYYYLCSMRKRMNILLYVSLVLLGYCCQVSRFQAASQQLDSTHPYAKNLAKPVLARLYQEPVQHKKLFAFIKKANEAPASFVPSSFAEKQHVRAHRSISPYNSPFFCSSPERGPPLLI